jgi:hypothetical protein
MFQPTFVYHETPCEMGFMGVLADGSKEHTSTAIICLFSRCSQGEEWQILRASSGIVGMIHELITFPIRILNIGTWSREMASAMLSVSLVLLFSASLRRNP